MIPEARSTLVVRWDVEAQGVPPQRSFHDSARDHPSLCAQMPHHYRSHVCASDLGESVVRQKNLFLGSTATVQSPSSASVARSSPKEAIWRTSPALHMQEMHLTSPFESVSTENDVNLMQTSTGAGRCRRYWNQAIIQAPIVVCQLYTRANVHQPT